MPDVDRYASKEEELRQRELEIRLRELELEVDRPEPPMYSTTKHDAPVKSMRSWKKDLTIAAKFSGCFLAGVVVIYISQFLAWISFFACLGTAGWVWFKYGQNKS